MFLVRKTFSDETFSSLKVFFFLNQIGILVMKFFVTRTFSDGVTLTKWVSSLKVQFRHKKSLVTKNWAFSDEFFRH